MSELTTAALEDTYPQAVLWSWGNRFKALGFVADVDRKLDATDTEIERLQAQLDAAKARHRELGIERGEHEENADAFLEMVADWCRNHGDLPLPPEPVMPPAPPPVSDGVRPVRMADVRVANGDPRALETREHPAVKPGHADPNAPVCICGDELAKEGGVLVHRFNGSPPCAPVDPLEPLAPGVIDGRADVTVPDTDQEGDRNG
ncbi:hypothetical protein [Actinomadura alba]|uniref:Uncharacterized protein n=1 Tax=Actinomadura alba TaxID=406431 RepID=A0ABR7LHQ9_9ACTN|nr:hypothetical protein [Actinomadura alba]MBC6464289.1 hypothetical protein [Actinomadura alba]